jgi:hypothetical protein
MSSSTCYLVISCLTASIETATCAHAKHGLTFGGQGISTQHVLLSCLFVYYLVIDLFVLAWIRFLVCAVVSSRSSSSGSSSSSSSSRCCCSLLLSLSMVSIC